MTQEKVINPLLVDNFLFIQGEDPQNAKRLKRKFNKRKIKQCMTPKSVTHGNFENEAVGLLYDYLVSMLKKNTRLPSNCVGVLCDTNVLLNNITRLPPPPVEWDVLCCESEIKKYKYESAHNNVYWCETSIKDTRHFVINERSIGKILHILKKSNNWSSFIDIIQKELLVYTITQYYLSERSALHIPAFENKLHSKTYTVEEKSLVVEEYGKKCNDRLRHISKEYINVKQMADKYDLATKNVSKADAYRLLPKISLVCVLTSVDSFFHTLHSFLKLDYPRDKLQLVIVDDFDGEKKLKHFLPEDSRIKIINITKNDKQQFVKLPVGYKLNTGVKYADHNIIYNFFDTHHYFVSCFRMLVKAFIFGDCDALLSCQTAYLTGNNSVVDDTSCLANMMYNKNFWKVDAFEESYNESNIVMYNFIKNRQGCIKYAPFLYFSFEHTTTDWYTKQFHKELNFNLKEFVDPLTKQSFDF
jgi:hypothetical protein